VAAVLVALMPTSCTSFDHETVLRTPDKQDSAADWWKDTIQTVPLEFLAVFTEVTDRHRALHTSAIYEVHGDRCETCGGINQEKWFTYLLPCPPPEDADALMRQRLTGYTFSRSKCQWRAVSARHCNGCSAKQAMVIWEEAHTALWVKD
jgi:hypothetical protein